MKKDDFVAILVPFNFSTTRYLYLELLQNYDPLASLPSLRQLQ